MSRRKDSQPASETLEEIESIFDRGGEWVTENPRPVLLAIGSILAVAAGIGLSQSYQTNLRKGASEDVGRVQAAYLEAMGARAGSPAFAEPANPETAKATRRTYAAMLLEAAELHPGSAAAVSARIDAGVLLAEAGDGEAAQAAWRAALDEAPGDSALRGVALTRLAGALEATDAAAASQRYEEAARIDAYPLAIQSLGHAARAAMDAGDSGRALAIFSEIEAREDGDLAPFVAAQLRELRAKSASN